MRKQFLSGLLASAGILAAADLPTAQAVFDKYIDATGGKAAYEKVNSVSMHGKLDITGQGLSGPITIITARPEKMDMTLELAGVGKIRSGAKDGMAWDYSAMQGPRLLEGEERDQRLRGARIDAFVNWKETYGNVKVDGDDTVDGKTCWRLLATPPKTTKVEKLWFDKQSGLLLKSGSTVVSPMGEMPAETFYADYRDVAGLKFPFKLTQSMGPQSILTAFDDMKVNPDLPATQFDPPAEVQALITKK